MESAVFISMIVISRIVLKSACFYFFKLDYCFLSPRLAAQGGLSAKLFLVSNFLLFFSRGLCT